MDRQPIISAKDVEINFSLRGRTLKAIRKCSLDLYEGESLAIVGESGSGKSVFTKTFVGMLDANGKIVGGSIMYEGRDMTKFTEKDWLGVRGKKIAMVIQDSDYATAGFWAAVIMMIAFVVIYAMNVVTAKWTQQ